MTGIELRETRHAVSPGESRVDPVTVEIIGNTLTAIAKRITVRMIRAAESLTVKESEDCSAALFDGRGRLIAESPSVPIHLNCVGICLKTVLEHYLPLESWRPEDVVLTNDPYAGGESLGSAHTSDFTAFQPVFWKAQLVAFAGQMVHHLDIGSAGMGGQGWNENIYQEGFRLLPVKIVEGGKIDKKVMGFIINNTRLPEMIENDITAQVTSLKGAEPEIQALFDKYSFEDVKASFDALIDNSEVRTREEIAKIPEGTYSNEIPIIDDGTRGGPFWLRVAVRKSGTELTFDFTGTDQQIAGPINAPLATVWATILYAIRCITDPTIPSTEGCLRPLHVVAPPGSLVNARKPAAVWQRMIVCQSIIDLIMGALAKAAPSRVIADSAGCQYNYVTSGITHAGTQLFFGKNEPGGIGATANADGLSAMSCHLNNCPIQPMEAVEVEHPVLFLTREFRPDSGGPGRWRGGLGEILRYKTRVAGLKLHFSSQKYKYLTMGYAGGGSGAPVRWIINEGTPKEVVFDHANGEYLLDEGDTVTHYTPGGGGFGDPKEREKWRLEADISAGLLSPEAAARGYGLKT